MSYTPDNVPPDTDRYIYRYVTQAHTDPGLGMPLVESQLMQIPITQP